MGLNFKRKEPVRQAFRRLGRRQLRRALKQIHQRDHREALHEVRKSIKRARAFVRLFRTSLGKAEYRRCAGLLRGAARLLSTARDAQVELKTLVCLIDRFKRELPPRDFSPLRRALSRECDEQQQALAAGKSIPRVCRSLTKACRQVSSIRLKESGWSALR